MLGVSGFGVTSKLMAPTNVPAHADAMPSSPQSSNGENTSPVTSGTSGVVVVSARNSQSLTS